MKPELEDQLGSAGPLAGGLEESDVAGAFPRLAVRDLVAESESQDRRRTNLQKLVVALGLALLALGLPTESLLGEGPGLASATGSGAWLAPHLLGSFLAQSLHRLGIDAERAWFLLAAAGWAGSYVVLSSMLAAMGVSRAVAVGGAAVALACPAAWLAGTLPSAAGLGLFGTTLVFATLLTPWMAQPAAWTRTTTGRIALLWLFAACLNSGAVLFLPAVAWGLVAGARRNQALPSTALRPLVLAVAAFVALHLAAASATTGTQHLRATWNAIQGAEASPLHGPIVWSIALLFGMAWGILGLLHLMEAPERPEEARPPAWFFAWLPLPFALQLLLGSPSLDVVACVLVPLVAAGVGSLLTRGEDSEGREMPRFALLLALQIAACALVWVLLARQDPNRAWTRSARKALIPGDLVVTSSHEHAHILRHRFGLEAVDLSEALVIDENRQPTWWSKTRARIENAPQANSRVVLDQAPLDEEPYPFEAELFDALLLAPYVRLYTDEDWDTPSTGRPSNRAPIEDLGPRVIPGPKR